MNQKDFEKAKEIEGKLKRVREGLKELSKNEGLSHFSVLYLQKKLKQLLLIEEGLLLKEFEEL